MSQGKSRSRDGMGTQAMFHLMMLPGMAFVAVFCFVPMIDCHGISGLCAGKGDYGIKVCRHGAFSVYA